MPTLTFKATEMKDAKVARISLVERAATRIPFRVIKQEKPMIRNLDLASVFKREVKQPAPELVGLITLKSESFEELKSQFVEAGFSVEKSSEMEDGSVVFAQSEDMEGEATLVRISEDAVVAVKGLRPYNMDMNLEDGTSFADVCKAQGFYPGVGTMVDVLRQSVLTVAEKADDPQSAATQISKMFDEAKQYAVSMVQSLPAKAFKLEFVGSMKEEDDQAAGAAEGQEPDAAAAAASDPAAAADTSAAAPEAAAKSDASGQSNEDPQAAQQAELAKALEGFASKFEASLTALGEALGEKLSGVSKSVKDLSERVESAEAVAKQAREAVEGTVVSGGDAGGDPQQVARKGEGSYRGREIDTAFAPRPRRAGR